MRLVVHRIRFPSNPILARPRAAQHRHALLHLLHVRQCQELLPCMMTVWLLFPRRPTDISCQTGPQLWFVSLVLTLTSSHVPVFPCSTLFFLFLLRPFPCFFPLTSFGFLPQKTNNNKQQNRKKKKKKNKPRCLSPFLCALLFPNFSGTHCCSPDLDFLQPSSPFEHVQLANYYHLAYDKYPFAVVDNDEPAKTYLSHRKGALSRRPLLFPSLICFRFPLAYQSFPGHYCCCSDLVEWMSDVQNKAKLEPEVFHLAVRLMDEWGQRSFPDFANMDGNNTNTNSKRRGTARNVAPLRVSHRIQARAYKNCACYILNIAGIYSSWLACLFVVVWCATLLSCVLFALAGCTNQLTTLVCFLQFRPCTVKAFYCFDWGDRSKCRRLKAVTGIPMVLQHECAILNSLGWQTERITSYDFFRVFVHIVEQLAAITDSIKQRATDLLHSSLLGIFLSRRSFELVSFFA